MKTSLVAKLFGILEPEERFALILQANARGDAAEADRLANAGGKIIVSDKDHAPFTNAFRELADIVFMELCELAATYLERFVTTDPLIAELPKASREEKELKTVRQRSFGTTLAFGFRMKTLMESWKIFTQRLKAPPFCLWENLPGFSRLERALKLAELAAFDAEGMVGWLKENRPQGKPEATTADFRAEPAADELEEFFRKRVEWWGAR